MQEIRWIGQTTQRAVGEFAPVRIAAGALHNEGDLLVSPDHRLFIYQRSDALGAGRSELLIKARHLVNGDSIQFQSGGFVDYFQLLFDRHQIIFAEGIAAETLLADQRTHAALPRDIAARLLADRTHDDSSHHDFEVSGNLLDRPDAAALLRRASTR
ncbi:Hint domain-containing protein [Phycobium rhodophyticola]